MKLPLFLILLVALIARYVTAHLYYNREIHGSSPLKHDTNNIFIDIFAIMMMIGSAALVLCTA